MGETCQDCSEAIDGNNCVRETTAGIHEVFCWLCMLKRRHQEARLQDPMTFLKGLGFGLAIGLSAWVAFR